MTRAVPPLVGPGPGGSARTSGVEVPQTDRTTLASGISSGLAWNAFELMVREGFQLVVKLILARLLLPEQFGLVGMAVVFTGLINGLSDLGLGSALVQRRERVLDRLQLDSAFWGTLVVAGALYALIVLAVAPFAVWFYDESAVYMLVVVLGLPVLLTPFTAITRAVLIRALRFRPVALADAGAAVLAGTAAIVAALLGAGVWSIAIVSVAAAVIKAPLLWLGAPWVPRLRFSWRDFQELFGFGKYITANGALGYFTRNVDYLLIGKLLGAQALGIYTLAFLLTDVLRSKVKTVFDNVFYPVFAREQGAPAALRKYYLLTVRYNAAVALPFVALLALYSGVVVPGILGDHWESAVVPVQILSLACAIHALGGSSAPVIRAIGRPDLNLRFSILKTAVAVPLIVAGAHYGGIAGVAWAVLGYKLFGRMLLQTYLRRAIGVREREIAAALEPIALGVGAMAAVYGAWRLADQPEGWFPVGLALGLSIAVYALVLYVRLKEEVHRILLLLGRGSKATGPNPTGDARPLAPIDLPVRIP